MNVIVARVDSCVVTGYHSGKCIMYQCDTCEGLAEPNMLLKSILFADADADAALRYH